MRGGIDRHHMTDTLAAARAIAPESRLRRRAVSDRGRDHEMNRRHSLAVLALGSAALLAGCEQAVQQVVTMPAAATCGFQVANESSLTVNNLFFSSSAVSGWGPDQLGNSVLPPGRARNFRPNNQGNYDFRVVWTNGRAAELRQVDPCRTRQVLVTNRGLLAR